MVRIPLPFQHPSLTGASGVFLIFWQGSIEFKCFDYFQASHALIDIHFNKAMILKQLNVFFFKERLWSRISIFCKVKIFNNAKGLMIL